MIALKETVLGWIVRKDIDRWHPSSDRNPVMRRKINGDWEERPMTARELREHEESLEKFDRWAW